MPQFGFSTDQFGCLDSLWTRESQWNPAAHNPSSGAHGIPQSLPGSKMASAGPDWATNPVTQITWGLGYIQDRYGSPCGAWGHSESSAGTALTVSCDRDARHGCRGHRSTSSASSSCCSVSSPRSTYPSRITVSRIVAPSASACLAILAAFS